MDEKKNGTWFTTGDEHPQDKTQEIPDVKEEVKNFCSETTAHGIGQIVKADTLMWYKVTWTVIFTFALIGNCFHLSTVVLDYLSYKSQETTYISSSKPQFPHVTLCNTNGVSQSSVISEVNDGQSEITEYYNLIESIDDSVWAEYLASTGIKYEDFMKSQRGYYGNLSPDSIKAISHSKNNFILDCKYMTTACDMENDWEMFIHPSFFTCYTYKGPSGDGKGKIAPGAEGGLSLVLYFENNVDSSVTPNWVYNVYSNVESSAGARVEIHEKNTLSIPDLKGINVMPGHSTSIGLRQTTVKKIGGLYSNCTNKKSQPYLEDYKYSLQPCMQLCLTKHVYKECGCIFGYTPNPDGLENKLNCAFYDNDTVSFEELVANGRCAGNTVQEFHSKKKLRDDCDCEEACKYHKYEQTVSASKWPGYLFTLDAYNEYVVTPEYVYNQSLKAYTQLNSVYENAVENETYSEFEKLMYDNFARLNIYFEETSVLVRKEEPSMSLPDLFANIGGTIGLWAGLSVITIIEFIFLGIKLTQLGIKRCKKGKEDKTSIIPMKGADKQ